MEKDFRSSIFFSDNERYADIINNFGCDGACFVKGKDLKEMDTRVILGKTKGLQRKLAGKQTFYRDLIRKTPFGVNFAIIGIENQEEIDYALPLRVLSYDVGQYQKQAAEIRKIVRMRRKGLKGGEYLYGFCKDSRLLPTVTFVLYWGEKDWDGPKDLHEILDFTGIPESLRKKIGNYRIHVIEVRKLEDTSCFKTDVRQVFDFVRFSKDKKKLKELIEKDESYQFLDEDAFDMVTAYAGEEKMLKWKEKHNRGGKINMCQGLQEWMEEERAEGEKRFAVLTRVMIQNGKTDELLKATSDLVYREKLYQEYKL